MPGALAVVTIKPETFLVVIVAAAVAGTLSTVVRIGTIVIPAVVIELLVVRGTPALLPYRRVLDRGERRALAFFSSTQLPLVVAITDLAVSTGHMRPSTAAALVGAAALSTLVYPILGARQKLPVDRPIELTS